MMSTVIPLTERLAWRELTTHFAAIKDVSLRTLFASDATRCERMSLDAVGIYLDYSKHRIDSDTLSLLFRLATESDVRGRIEAMFAGEKINSTEQRSALHVALRAPDGASLGVDGRNVVPDVHAVLKRMASFSTSLRNGTWKGHSGKNIRHIVNIGIGGSDLGPVMAYEALRHYSQRDLTLHFISNVDGTDFIETTKNLDPAETLFIISSKTFSTTETMTNAHSARQWSLAALKDDSAIAKHFVAVSTNATAVADFGIDPAHMFGFWDWVGGRYSMDNAIGLSTMIAIGPDLFSAMLSGFHEMDEHFKAAPFERNLPVIMAVLTVWYNNFFGANPGDSTLRPVSQAPSCLPTAIGHGK